MKWEALIIPAIAVAVWILTSLFRRDDTPPKGPQRPQRFGEAPRQNRPVTRLERRFEESRRRQEAARRADLSRPIVLEEVKVSPRRPPGSESPRPVILELAEPPAQTSLQETRAGYAPTQSPSKTAPAKPPLAAATLVTTPAAVQTSLQEPRAGFAPTQSPSDKRPETPQTVSSTLVQVRQMLRSPKSAAAAIVLQEILGQPRCRRRI